MKHRQTHYCYSYFSRLDGAAFVYAYWQEYPPVDLNLLTIAIAANADAYKRCDTRVIRRLTASCSLGSKYSSAANGRSERRC